MASPRATVAFVPREVFCTTRRSLETLYERTREPFDLVCIDGGSPPRRAAVPRTSRPAARQFTLVRTDGYVTPNQARNLAVRHVRTPYVVFVDNDVLVTEGWLDAAGATAPTRPAPGSSARCTTSSCLKAAACTWSAASAASSSTTAASACTTNATTTPTSCAPTSPSRSPACETELIEFHTVLVSMQAFRELGPLDEGLLCNAEHGDLCLTVRNAGHSVYLEPAAQITYAPPKRLEPDDEAFFLLRWSEAWAAATHRRIDEKWNLTRGNRETKRARRWVADHRRYRLLWLNKLRKWIGPKWAKTFEKRLVAPFESAQNRRRFPFAKFGAAPQVTSRVVYQPPQVSRQAA